MDDLRTPVERNELWFDTSLYAKGEDLRKLVDGVQSLLLAHPEERKRPRARKEKDQRSLEACLDAVTSNLAYVVLNPTETGRLVFPRDRGRKIDRYANPRLPAKTLNAVVDRLNGPVLNVTVGQRGFDTSSIAPTDWFKKRVQEAGVTPEDFGRDPNQEVIVLNRSTKTKGWTSEGVWAPQRRKRRMDYKDTAETHALRHQVQKLNAFLEEADIAFVDDGLEPPVDPLRRRLFRYFQTEDDTQRFDRGGRLFGGFWINLKRARRINIRIGGEPIADLDFKNMFARLAYARVGQEPPEGDLYDLTDLLEGYDRTNETHRDGVKQAFNSVLNGGMAGSPEIGDLLPEEATPRKVREAIRAKHPPLSPILETDVGMGLQLTESQVLLQILEDLMDKGIVALPIHDGLMVAQSHAETARKAMEALARETVGIPMPVVVKAS